MKLSEAEMAGLQALHQSETIAADRLPDRNETDLWGDPVPGRRVWMGLVRKGLVLIPEEDPIDLGGGEMFTCTAFLELTEEGRRVARGC